MSLKLSETAQVEFNKAMQNPDIAGFLSKKGAKRRNWTKRYFALSGQFLFYSKDKTSSAPQGVINVQGCSVAEIEGPNIKPYSFTLLAPRSASADARWENRTYFILCSTSTERLEWMDAILKAGIKAVKQSKKRIEQEEEEKEKKIEIPAESETDLEDLVSENENK